MDYSSVWTSHKNLHDGDNLTADDPKTTSNEIKDDHW